MSKAQQTLPSHSEHVSDTIASQPHWGFSCNEVIRYEAGHWSCLLIQRLQLQQGWNRFVTEASQSQGELPSRFQLVSSTEFIVCFYCGLLFLMALLWSGMDIILKRCFREMYCATTELLVKVGIRGFTLMEWLSLWPGRRYCTLGWRGHLTLSSSNILSWMNSAV